MPSDEEIIGKVARTFVGSRDFNGVTGWGLARSLGVEWSELQGPLERLVVTGQVSLVFASHSVNPHIKRLADLGPEQQVALLRTETPGGVGVYPTRESLKLFVDPAAYAGRPYTQRLAFAEAQLTPIYFELRVLAQYFNDPRYACRFWDRSGMISVSDEHYGSEAMPEKDKALLQSFGIGYDENRHRVVVVFLRYLSDLSPQHQAIWQAHECAGRCTMNSDYLRSSVYGAFPEHYSAYEAFINEQIEINKLAVLIGKPPLFKATFDEDRRPTGFSPMLLPTKKQFLEFAHLLDKMTSENLNRAFFDGDVDMEDRIPSGDGTVERRQVNTITMLERWLSKKYRTSVGEDVSKEISGPLRAVRKLRQPQAHALTQDAYDVSYPKQQDDLMEQVIRSLTRLRLVLMSHPGARGKYEPPDWLDGDKIVFY